MIWDFHRKWSFLFSSCSFGRGWRHTWGASDVSGPPLRDSIFVVITIMTIIAIMTTITILTLIITVSMWIAAAMTDASAAGLHSLSLQWAVD